MQKNPIVFWELASHDMEKSAAFFRDVFEWDINMNERLGFYIAPATNPLDEAIDGGIFTLGKARLPFVALYIQVVDIDAKAKLIEEKGGFIVEAPFDNPGGSRICLFNEPSGVTFAMIQPKSPKSTS
jgi:predicted enzyme related to lactoylglutathione lyase